MHVVSAPLCAHDAGAATRARVKEHQVRPPDNPGNGQTTEESITTDPLRHTHTPTPTTPSSAFSPTHTHRRRPKRTKWFCGRVICGAVLEERQNREGRAQWSRRIQMRVGVSMPRFLKKSAGRKSGCSVATPKRLETNVVCRSCRPLKWYPVPCDVGVTRDRRVKASCGVHCSLQEAVPHKHQW